MKKILIFTAIIFGFCVSKPVLGSKANLSKEEKEVFKVLKEELNRSMDQLKKKGSIKPYFIAYTLKENDVSSINASYGADYGTTSYRLRKILVEVRVGGYDYDNSDIDNTLGRRISSFVEVGGDLDSLRRDLWFQTNAAYEYALKLYYYKKQQRSDKFKKKAKIPSYSRERSHKYYDDYRGYVFDVSSIRGFLKKATQAFRKYPGIQIDILRCNLGHEKIFFVNSEGSEILTRNSLMNVSIDASTQASDGSEIQDSGAVFYNLKYTKLDLARVKEEIARIARELSALKESPQISPATGPALLSPQATGVLFHEAVGHRLEGERQEREEEGRTFEDSLGKAVIPTFISIYDDPTAVFFEGHYLNGHYRFDGEGMPGEKVNLIEKGVLKNFLLSRTPIEGFKKSNGHGRAYDDLVPMARMSNFFVRSIKAVPAAKLKSLLVKECKRQEKSHGFIIASMTGGETETAIGKFQVFKSVPQMVYRVDAKTGSEELVRGVEIVGTPLSSINKILVTGDDYEVKNGYCGAESGWLKVATVAPSSLISEVELQNRRVTKKQLPIIDRPD